MQLKCKQCGEILFNITEHGLVKKICPNCKTVNEFIVVPDIKDDDIQRLRNKWDQLWKGGRSTEGIKFINK
jgi:phage FluMu protein Com